MAVREAAMSGIFISYRREDSSGWVGHLARLLQDQFRADEVFMDSHTIEPGMDFVDVLATHLRSCDVLLAVIGPHWLTAQDRGGRHRLEDPTDYVRLEITAALERDIRVIPVLVGGATMPTVVDLPAELGKLVRRQAHELSDTRWEYDTNQLVMALEKVLGKPALRVSKPPERPGGRWSPASRGIMTALLLLVSGIMVALGLGTVFSRVYPSIEITFNLVLLFMLVGWLLVLTLWGIGQTLWQEKP
jgi:hypothetical protein